MKDIKALAELRARMPHVIARAVLRVPEKLRKYVSFSYDSLSRLIKATNPESGITCYGTLSGSNCTESYDADGNVLTRTDARGIWTSYTYDPLHRLLGKTYSDTTPSVSYSYDASTYCSGPTNNCVGHLGHEAAGAFARNYAYDPMGRLKQQVDFTQSNSNPGFTTSAQYNLAGSLSQLIYPSGRIITYSYPNQAGWLQTVVGPNTGSNYTFASISDFLPSGAPKTTTYGNGTQQIDNYNSRLQVSRLQLYKDTGHGTIYADRSYTWSASGCNAGTLVADNGNLCGITDNLGSVHNQIFTYDGLNRILTAQQADSAFNQIYTVDLWGNLKQSGPPNNFLQGFNSKNQISEGDGSNPSSWWCYDAAGNQLDNGICPGGSTHLYAWDAEERLQSVNGASNYTYAGSGDRVRKDAASWTEYLIFGGNSIAKKTPTGWADYIFLQGRRFAETTALDSSTVQFYWSDHLNSARVMTSSSGSKLCDTYFAPFGQEVGGSPCPSQYKFTGKERDTETSLDYFGARYYGSNMGRFSSPDPSGLLAQRPEDPQSWNLYVYARNNPLIYIDPNGLDCIYATDNGKGVEWIDHNSSSGECGQNGGTWLSGKVDENWAHYNKKAGAFEAASEDGGQVNFAQFQAGALTNDSGNCLSGCGSYGFASADAGWLTGQLVGNSKPTDGSDPLNGLLTFMTNRGQAVSSFWKAVAGPLDPSKDNWAGPGGMGVPGGSGDWRAAVHDYNFDTNHIKIGSYFNPHLSLATSKALIQSNNNLMRTGGVQGAKEKMVFGVINAFQWYANSWK